MLRGYFDWGGPHLPPDFVQTRCAPVSVEGITVMQGAPAKIHPIQPSAGSQCAKNRARKKHPKNLRVKQTAFGDG
ncbi:hypothetical protein BN874_2980004 [Candidatus Contendobacter odensis Run_B_J11]|uniref:Uncharacterized protein n=1 Tax=Candidatus Contendobacter odensis Run_B_J11 TaxID=1400861 RepID=A0A7U7J390_9GAMM|nr:hypothetical protein BN874_2980004 [Candidatus Contendobacter odensis Run_B_J11]